MTPGTELKPGDKVLVALDIARYENMAGKIAEIAPEGEHQFEDELTVFFDNDICYVKVEDLTPLPPITKTAPEETPSSFHFFEVLLDAAEEAHPSSKSFYNELITCGLLHAQKQRDYGKPSDPFANVRSTEEWGTPGWIGAMQRLNDKVKRLQTLARTGGLANESAIDSFRDIAVYALISLVLYQQESAKDTA